MQRTNSRSQFPAVKIADLIPSNAPHRPFPFGWTFPVAVAIVLAGCGLASAADPDNVLLDFTAVWCGPCQQMSSIVSKLERQGFAIRKVDVDNERALASKYGVQQIPCFVLVADGRELDRVNGLTTEQQLRSMLNRLPASREVAQPPQNRRSEGSPDLGNPAPLTPPGDSIPRRQFLPVDPEDHGPEIQSPFNSPTIRSQTPEPNPMGASVRIRVKDGNSINYGSGTIIESQPGHATILSCGHIFRKLSRSAIVEIDLYANVKAGKPETVTGRVLLTDLDADVGLVSINYPQMLPTVRLGVSTRPLAKGDKLFSIGCSGGANPTQENLELTGINRYKGPANLECTNRPVKGRSGGGLFRDDELVGVCIAANPEEQRGLYAGLQPIGLLLEKADLAHLAPRIPKTSSGSSQAVAATEPRKPVPKLESTGSNSFPEASGGGDLNQLLAEQLLGGDAGTGATVPEDLAGAEIICIVRSRVPGKPSRVVIVNQASDSFMADLFHESTGGAAGRSTTEQNTAHRLGGSAERGPVETSFEPQAFRRQRAK